MDHPPSRERYREGALLARANAELWLDEARRLQNDGNPNHALAAAILGCEEAVKMWTWLSCAMMAPDHAHEWERRFRRRSDRHSLQMFMALWVGHLVKRGIETGAIVQLGTAFVEGDHNRIVTTLHQVMLDAVTEFPFLIRAIPHLHEIRGVAFYVDWLSAEDRFRTPMEAPPSLATTFLEAGHEMLMAADRVAAALEAVNPDDRETLERAWSEVIGLFNESGSSLDAAVDDVLKLALGSANSPSAKGNGSAN
jgi:hypothetical protein